jgi:hypothetical protein
MQQLQEGLRVNYERIPTMVSRESFLIYDGLHWIGEIRVARERADEFERQVSKMWAPRSEAAEYKRQAGAGAADNETGVRPDADRVRAV